MTSSAAGTRDCNPVNTCMVWPAILVDDEVVGQITRIGIKRAPEEACGILIGGVETGGTKVIELPNHSKDPKDSCAADRDEMIEAIDQWYDGVGVDQPEDYKLDLIFWHTHPDGFIGPSRRDLRAREEGVKYLVVAIPGGTAVRF